MAASSSSSVPHAIEHLALFCRGERRGPSQQRCGFALPEIVADRLARERRVSERADHVVADLEGVAEWQPEHAQSGEQLVTAFGRGQQRTEVERALDGVLPALVAGDALGLVEPAVALDRPEDVEELADVELQPQLVPQPPDRVRHADQELVREHEGEIADEDRHPLAEAAGLAGPRRPSVLPGVYGVGGRGAAPAHGVVHHVVVEQREAVHQLDAAPASITLWSAPSPPAPTNAQ